MTIGMRSSLCAASLALLSTTVAAGEICVKCSGPDANYDCVVNGSSAANTVTKLYCITALAKAGPHASCAIDRNSVAPCQGERKEFAIPTGLDGGLGGVPQQNAAGQNAEPSAAAVPGTSVTAVAPDDAEFGAPKVPPEAVGDAPPKTVQEMMEKSAKSASDSFSQTQKSAGDAAKSASSALGKAGSAVGNAAKTSWKCLSSFFSNC